MRANLELTQGFVLSESVMLGLARKIGKQSAHRLVYDASLAARAGGATFREAMLGSREIAAHLSPAEIDALLDYDRATGACREMVDRVLAAESRA
jgi:adenylosuccinate lyase